MPKETGTCVRVGREESLKAGAWEWGSIQKGPAHPPGYTQTYMKYSAEKALGERVALLSEVTVYLGCVGR